MHRRSTSCHPGDFPPSPRVVEATAEEVNNRDNEVIERAQLAAVIFISALLVALIIIALVLYQLFAAQ
ncbi:ORF009 [Saltwater crocodilepox virus]|nr:ORF009 [Saltwater crocodilepox virus]QGT48162.1 ORF009 [Saltwater crocodilepox virus]QGT48378.1 ORF009 [Saltwater crocodilepox virus]QGT48592.1 ORF009 [Saltwater crocodilepox virus]